MPEDSLVADSSQDSRLAFRESYLNRLVPVLTSIREQGSGLALSERLRAIKFAADMSLALTAGGVSWSRALGKDLSRQFGGNNLLGNESYPVANQVVPRKLSTCVFPMRALVTNRKRKFESTVITNRAGRAASSVLHARVGRYRSFLKQFRRRRAIQRHLRSKHATYLKEFRSLAPRTSLPKKSRLETTEASLTERQITSLSKVIPGGRAMDAPMLLKETADYIISLQMQIEALESLAEASISS